MDKNLPLFPAIGFGFLTITFAVLLITGLHKGLRKSPLTPAEQKGYRLRFILLLCCWLLASGGISLTGFFTDFSTLPPRFAILLLVPIVLSILLLVNKRTKIVLRHISPAAIMGLQCFRIGVEILLWSLHKSNTIPVQMSFEGLNFDVLTGLTALPFAWLCFRGGKTRRGLAIAWNVAGLLLLVNIVVIAITSTPSPMRLFMNEPANTVVAYFPFVWLPAFLVPLAYTLHFLSIKQMLDKSR